MKKKSKLTRQQRDNQDQNKSKNNNKSIPDCDKSAVLGMARTVREMIVLSVRSLELRNKNAAAKLYQMDDTVDALYRKYLRELIAQQNDVNKRETDARCYISG